MKRCLNSKGQAALEFLSTYGFAFFILLVTLGVISYTGIFNISSLKSNECFFPQGAECLEFALATSDPGNTSGPGPYLQMILYNSYGVDLTIISATAQSNQISANSQGCGDTLVSTNILWPSATNVTLWCMVPPGAYHVTQRYDSVIELNFTQSGAYTHSIKGQVSTAAQ